MMVELTLLIDYDSGDEGEIKRLLCDAAEHLYDNGLLSGNDPDITISGCTHSVALLHRDSLSVPYKWEGTPLQMGGDSLQVGGNSLQVGGHPLQMGGNSLQVGGSPQT
jgi:hypothetical protein